MYSFRVCSTYRPLSSPVKGRFFASNFCLVKGFAGLMDKGRRYPANPTDWLYFWIITSFIISTIVFMLDLSLSDDLLLDA